MKIRWSFALLVLVCAVALPLSAGSLSPCDAQAGNLVVNCGFETGDFSGWTTGGNFGATGVTSGPFYAYSVANSGTYYAVLGPVGSDGILSQTLTTNPGDSYTVSFYLDAVGDGTSDFSAYWNTDVLMSVGNPNTGDVWTQYLFTVIGTGSDTIQLNFRDDPAYIALDDIVVLDAGTAIPEPGSLGLLISGLAVVILARRRRRA
ncbi:MAG: carbohydrate binding domain-containing protein [Bryobacteraceae bacterium]|jgi:hypothetical protein